MPDCGVRPYGNFSASCDRSVANYRQTVSDGFSASGRQSGGFANTIAGDQAAGYGGHVGAEKFCNGHAAIRRASTRIINIITAQTTLLTNQQTAVNLRRDQMTARRAIDRSARAAGGTRRSCRR